MNEWYSIDDVASEKFYRVPKAFAKDKKYRTMSSNAKLLYSYIRDRYELSISNGWTDQYGRVYCYYAREGMAYDMGLGVRTIIRVMQELTENDLLHEDKRNKGQANRIYIKRVSDNQVPNRHAGQMPGWHANELKSFRETEGRQQLLTEGKNQRSVTYLIDSNNRFVKHYHEVYKEYVGEEHPPLKNGQMDNIEQAISKMDLKRVDDMYYVIDNYFEEMEQSKSRRNINMFKSVLPLAVKDAMVDRKWEDWE